MKKTNTKEERKPAYWSHNRRALFKMDSPTRRQLVVGFLEPAEKNAISAEKPSDWTIAAATHGADQLQPRRSLFTDVHALWLTGRKELWTLFFNEKTHCSLNSTTSIGTGSIRWISLVVLNNVMKALLLKQIFTGIHSSMTKLSYDATVQSH